LPDDWRRSLLAMTFGVVLFTLLFQGTTIKWLLNRLGLVAILPERHEYELVRARMVAMHSARDQLQRMHQAGVLTESVWESLRVEYQNEAGELSRQIRDLYANDENLEHDEMIAARVDGLRSQRSALQTLVRRGQLSDHGYHELATEIDVQLERLTGSHE
jgi:CPA1 family monovalent cation:H+ antiporter